MPATVMPMVQLRAKRAAAEWCDNRDAARETEARLRRSKFDNMDINAEVFVQAHALFEMFDRLAQLAQSRRIGLLREISLRREFFPARPARHWDTGRSVTFLHTGSTAGLRPKDPLS